MITLSLKPLSKNPPPTKTPAAAAKPRPLPLKNVVVPHKTQPLSPVKKTAPPPVTKAAAHATPDAVRSPATPPPAFRKDIVQEFNPVDLPVAARTFIPPAATTPTGDVYSSKPAAAAPVRAVAPPPQANRLTPIAQNIAAQVAEKNQIPVETRQIYSPPVARSLPGANLIGGVLRTAALSQPINQTISRHITGTVGGSIGGVDINLNDDTTPTHADGDDASSTGKMILIAALVLAAAVLLLKRRR